MSAYVGIKTEFQDQECLASALTEMGYEVKSHAEAKQLQDYCGNLRPDTAEVIVPRRSVNKFSGGASNDIGFKKQPDGTYKAVISEYDQNKHGADFLRRLKVTYSEKKTCKKATAQGMKFVSRETTTDKNGKAAVRLIFQAELQKR
jgi:hypothetical protein